MSTHLLPESRERCNLLSELILMAFEAKLKDWRYGLDQAYRNTCFAHKSYVVVPEATALPTNRELAKDELPFFRATIESCQTAEPNQSSPGGTR